MSSFINFAPDYESFVDTMVQNKIPILLNLIMVILISWSAFSDEICAFCNMNNLRYIFIV